MITIQIKKKGELTFTDRTDQIKDVQITQGVTKEATTGSLTVTYKAGGYKPEGEDEVMIYDDAVAIFGGFISRPTQKAAQGPIITYECDLKNKVHILDRKLVNTTYDNETAKDIIEDIVSKFSDSSITTVNVEDDSSATGSFTFNNVSVSTAIQQIADQFSKEWYVDPEGDIHFFSKFGEAAPFDLDDDGGKYIWESLEVTEDYTQIKNSILVEGGKEKSTVTDTDKFVGNGETSSFVLSRIYTDITVTVGGVAKTVGIQNIDSFDDHDCLYDYDQGIIYFNPSTPPAADAVIEITGYYYFAIAVKYTDVSSIGEYGEREFRIQDKNISSRNDAKARARAEIAAYAQAVSEGTFETYESGLFAGQKIHVGSLIRDLSADFIIQRVQGKMLTAEKMVWTVTIVSVKTYEIIDLLAQIVRNNAPSETSVAIVTANSFNKAESVARTITIGSPMSVEKEETVNKENIASIDAPPQWVAGPFVPPGKIPFGFRLPTLAEWQAEKTAGGWANRVDAFNSPLKLPAAGDRSCSSGVLYYVGSYGYYWASSVNGSYSYYLAFNSSSATTANTARAYGFPVRCITDLDIPDGTSVYDSEGLEYKVVTSPAGKKWLDRNLGATQVATAYNDPLSYGDLYQWGRPSDGHEKRTSGTTTTMASSKDTAGSKFIINATSPYDWISPADTTLWTKLIENRKRPCFTDHRCYLRV